MLAMASEGDPKPAPQIGILMTDSKRGMGITAARELSGF